MKNWKLWAKKILVLTLSTAMTVSAVDIPVVAAAMEMSGSDDARREIRITEFAPLEASIREQVLTIGASEKDIQFPDALTVTIEQKGTVQEDTQENSEDQQKEDQTEAPEKGQEKEDREDQEDQTEAPEEDQEKEDQGEETEDQEKEDQEEETEDPEKEQQKGETENQEEKQEQETGKSEEAGTENEGVESTSGGQENNQQEEQQSVQQEEQDGSNAALTASVKESWLEKAADVLFPPMEVYAADLTTEANDDIEETQQQTEVPVTQEESTLEGITWKLNIKESDAEVFDSSEQSAGLCYVYTPVLPENDADGNALTVADDVELPQIYVLIEGHKVQTLSSNEVIDIADVKTNANGQIVINSDNWEEWNNKILTGSVVSTGLYDSAKGLVIDGVKLNLTIRDLIIDRKEFMRNGISAIELSNRAVLNLTLEGDNKLYGAYGGAGIGVGHGTALCITEESSGSLYAKGGNGYGGAAGIGAISPGWNLDSSSSMPQEQTCGYIQIAGGNVKAEGGTYSFQRSEICGAAGIGGSYGASVCKINITGGNVTAIGGMYAAGIGGGTNGSVASITISGGTVVAEGTGKGMRQPAAIGRGIDTVTEENYDETNVLPCGVIELTGGNVTAKGNIGYGYVESGYYPISSERLAKVTVSDEVFLTLDGEIQDGSQSAIVKNYELNFTVFDTAFTTVQEQMTAKVEWGSSLIQEKVAAKVTTPGQAPFTLSFAHNAFSGMQTFTVTIDGKTYEAEANFSEDKTEYDLTAGKELYPVSLEFYDNAITREVAVKSISVKQDGTDLKSTDYVQPGRITQVDSGIGKMLIFLPADETGTTEITVNAPGINSSESMTQSELTIGKTGINTVAMCIGKVTLSAKESKVNATDVTFAVESNVMTWDLYIKESAQEIVKAEDIISDETKHSQTAQKGEVHLENLGQGVDYTYYMVAKKDNLVSDIVRVSFTTPRGAKVYWENDSSQEEKYYEGFFNAVNDAGNISQDGFTIQALGIANWGSELTLKKSCKLDLNGQNVSINGTYQYSLKLADGVSAVLTDSTGGAEYHNANGNATYTFFNMASDSSLTIQGGNYYDYKELLKAQTNETQTGRTLTIEGGSFHGSNSINIGDGTVILAGGTFYGGLSINGNWEIKDGYCMKYLSGSNEGTYTTELPGIGKDKDIEIVPLPALTGELDLKVGKGTSSSARVGTELKAIFTDKDSGNGNYTYTWYRVDGDKEEVIQTSSRATTWKTSTYSIKQADIGKQIYCKVTKEGTSGSVESEKTYSVLGYSIEDTTIKLNPSEFDYDGTEKKPTVTVFAASGGQISKEVSYTVSYADNINAGTARVIITGCGTYDGTAETTFTINKRKGNYTIEGVANSYEYTGEDICPEIVIMDGDKEVPKSDYTVSYENNKMPGTATIRITGTENGNYSFENCNKQFQIVHEHKWKCDVKGSLIRLYCRKDVCTCEKNNGTLMLNIQNPEDLKYNGETQNVAQIFQSREDIYPEDKIKLEYTGAGLENGLPKNAGDYTANMSIVEGGKTYTAKLNFTIQKADTKIGTVTANELQNTLDVDQVQLSRTDTTIPGTLKLKEGTTLQYGTHEYDWVFEPTDSVNYETLVGTVSITVKDTIAPRAEWKIGTSIWREFVNTISFGTLCKNTETMEIMFKDAQSGVASKQYYIANQEITDFSDVEWTDYTAPVVLPPGRVRIVYVRVTDHAGNISILNSDGLTVYQESLLKRDEISYPYKEGIHRELYIDLNGNSFYEVVDDKGQSLPQNSYGYWQEDNSGCLTLSSVYLDSLGVGTHTYKIKLCPQGADQNVVETLAYSFSITVEKAKLYVIDAQAENRTYDGSRLVNITGITLERVDSQPHHAGEAEVSISTNGLRGTLEKADAGTYQNVTLPTLTLTGTGIDNYELVQPGGPVYLLPTVTISKKAAPVISTKDKSYVYTKDTEEAIDLTEFLPADCGEAVFGTPGEGSGKFGYYKVDPTVNGNILSYTVGKTTMENLQKDQGGELVIPVQMTNYEDTEIKFTLRLRDQIKVILKPGTEVQLENNELTYGEPLSKLIFKEAVFTDEDGNAVEGVLGWNDGASVPQFGQTKADWQFIPADTGYKTVEGSIAIVVNPATPTVETPAVVAERTYDPTKALEDSDLSGGVVKGIDGKVLDGTWSWKQTGIIPTVNNSGYEAVFTPTGVRCYTAVSTTVEVKVQKAEPVITQNPTAAEITYGLTLAASALSGGTVQHSASGTTVIGSFAWKDATIKPSVADSNQTAYAVVFTPADTENYKPVETTVTLNIKRAKNAPNFPEDHMDVKYVCRKVKDVQLPDGWEWKAADQEKELEVGTPVTATAVYTGEGHGNYETESTTITMTRLECQHPDTKLKGVVAASCGKKGYSGDTVCKDCDFLMKEGSPTAALTHDYRESGRKEPTSYAEGAIIYTCIHCKNSYSVRIERLPDNGNNGEASDGDGSSSSGLPAGTTATPVPTAGEATQSPAPAPTSAPASRPASTPVPSDSNKETKEPFIKGEDGKEGWQVIESQTDEATEGETIHVDMNGATTVPGTIFDSIKGRNITVTFDLGGGILWTVNGLDVTAQNAKDIDFGVTMGEQAGRNIPVDVINNVTGERYSMNLTLAYEGEFGFTATLTVNMDAANAGLYANLFYYNPETGELEFMCAGKIDEAGNTELTFNHASDYTIVIDTEPMNGDVQDAAGEEAGTEPDDIGAAPSGQTTDEATDGNSGSVFDNGIFWILIGAAVIVIAAVGAVYVLRRKKEDQKQ